MKSRERGLELIGNCRKALQRKMKELSKFTKDYNDGIGFYTIVVEYREDVRTTRERLSDLERKYL